MSARFSPDDDVLENDVRYDIADCRKRLRSQRATLRTRTPIPIEVSRDGEQVSAQSPESYAEILATVSMNHSSLARLVECLLEPVGVGEMKVEETLEREEAVIT